MSSAWMGEDFGCLESSGDEVNSANTNIKETNKTGQKSNDIPKEVRGNEEGPKEASKCEEKKPIKAYEQLDEMSSAWMGEDFGCLESSGDEVDSTNTNIKETNK